MEHQPKAEPSTTWKQTDQGLEISAMRTLRFTTAGNDYAAPMVLMLEHVQPAIETPAVDTLAEDHHARRISTDRAAAPGPILIAIDPLLFSKGLG